MRPCWTAIVIVSLVFALVGGAASAGELKGTVAAATKASPAVVWVEGLESSAVPVRDVVLTYEDGHLRPYVDIGFVGSSFVLRNRDDELHNVHLYLRLAYQKKLSERPLEYGATLFNVALPAPGTEVRKPIHAHHRYQDETGFIEVACNRHSSERSYLLVFDHPYAAVTADDGTFSIADVPAGEHEIRVWHDGKVKVVKAVEVESSAATTVDLGD